MERLPESQPFNRIIIAARLGTYLTLVMACAVLIGWWTDISVLTSFRSGLASTSVATAIGFILSATAIHSVTLPAHTHSTAILLGRLCAALVIIIGVYAIGGYVVDLQGAGYLLGPNFGRVSPATATCFIFLAAAVLSIDKNDIFSGGLIAAGLTIVELDLVGYAFGIAALYHVMPFSAMALPTALLFAILFIALLMARPQQGWLQYAFRRDRVGTTFRLLLPAVIIIPFLLAYATSQANDMGIFDASFGFAILAVATTVVLSGLICFVAAWLVRADASVRQAEEDLLQNAQILETAMGVAQLGAWIADVPAPEMAERHIEWSTEMYRIFGMEADAIKGPPVTVAGLIHPDDLQRVIEANSTIFDRDTSLRITYRINRPDGALRWVQQQARVIRDANGTPVRMAGIVQDVTEARLVEQQLVQAQKMESIGNLTGGMAHDFNNLLGVIVGNLDLVSGQVDDSEPAELIGDALDAALRGADLTRRLLAFARRQPLQPRIVQPNELIANIVALLTRTLGESIEISLNLSPEVSPILVDPAQLEASITNLANNARDAMPKGGRLIITTANRHLDADYVAGHSELSAGDYVMIEVSDTGTGIPPEILSRIFEPFFSTKEEGRGTGLGLSMAFGFMKQSGGHINVYSELGSGTTFRLYLPVAEKRDAATEATAVETPVGGTETLLVVEDNPAMRRVVVRQLVELGYRVIEANSGAVALDILRNDRIDLLFSDVVMPGGMDGVELVRAARADHPHLKVLLTSGFPAAKLEGNGEIANISLLSKPYRRDDLARALRDIFVGR